MRDTRLLDAAGREAETLRHGWIGVEHLLLALGKGDGPAAQALVDVDLWVAPPGDEWSGAMMTAALQETLAFVEGFTVGREATPEDALVAVLWMHPAHVALRRDEIAARLGELGVAVPELPELPPPTDFGEEVRFPLDQLAAVMHAVHAADPDARIAFDHDGEGEVRMRCQRGLDLEAVVAGVTARSS
ncbi:MAG TPA: Clp protease N-terminal domain-containing protein [Gaiellaceae bacterium]|nr:Clp protease N-terminal domain-containing protein [Gaiellaceae bacterium]